MNLRAIWQFIAGDSRRAPVAVVLAIIVALVLVRTNPASAIAGLAFACIVALGLAAAVFERT
ncbi:MAG TPA: hypothetical protein VHS78_15740 [Candidatus Elarobacter sp.]|jgi:hypothetical protein|nr:hypothetical protein [Candidatus Elarobacter sp.]